ARPARGPRLRRVRPVRSSGAARRGDRGAARRRRAQPRDGRASPKRGGAPLLLGDAGGGTHGPLRPVAGVNRRSGRVTSVRFHHAAEMPSEGARRPDETTCANAIFQQPWWLDAVAPGRWGESTVERGGRIVARLPFVVRGRGRLRML